MVSGMYLGEISRNMLLHFVDLSLLFDGFSSPVLNTHYGYDAAFVSAVEGAKPEDVKAIVVDHLGIEAEHVTDSCAEIVQWACEMVARRASALAACAIAAVVQHTGKGEEPIDVGLDGSVAEFLPNFQGRVRKALTVLLGDGATRIKMGLAKDGSGVGAALTALQAKKAMDTRGIAAAPGKPTSTATVV